MKKSEANLTEQSAEQVDAPIRLTPDQLEGVAAGFAAQLRGNGGRTTSSGGGGATQGFAPAEPPIRMF